jgi:hypothetical protein
VQLAISTTEKAQLVLDVMSWWDMFFPLDAYSNYRMQEELCRQVYPIMTLYFLYLIEVRKCL